MGNKTLKVYIWNTKNPKPETSDFYFIIFHPFSEDSIPELVMV